MKYTKIIFKNKICVRKASENSYGKCVCCFTHRRQLAWRIVFVVLKHARYTFAHVVPTELTEWSELDLDEVLTVALSDDRVEEVD